MNEKQKMQSFLDELNNLNDLDLSVESVLHPGGSISRSQTTIVPYKESYVQIRLIDPKIQKLPDVLPKFEHLRILFIRHTSIKEMPKTFLGEYAKLRKLNIYNNENLQLLYDDTFSDMVVENLSFACNNLLIIPEGLFTDSQVFTLSLSDNLLQDFHVTTFDPLTNLSALTLDSNQLQSIPTSLFMHQKNLEVLVLSKNQLEWLEEDTFCRLPKLKKLYLDGNNSLNNIPDMIFKDNSKLEYLSLPSNSNIPLSVGATSLKSSNRGIKVQDFKTNWMEYIAPSRVIKLLNQIEPNIPVNIDRIAELANIDKNTAERSINKILQSQQDMGKYLPLEQVYIKEAEIKIETVKTIYPPTKLPSSSKVHICNNCKNEQSVMIRNCNNCDIILPHCNICKRGFTNDDKIVLCEHCGNQFHQPHLFGYIQSKGSCPICNNRLTTEKIKIKPQAGFEPAT